MLTLRPNKITLSCAFLLALVISAAYPSCAEVEELSQRCSALSPPGHYPEYMSMPNYSVVRRDQNASNPSVLSLRIKIDTEAFGGAAILRLGCKLFFEYPQETIIEALIFDDVDSAKRLAPGFGDQAHYGKYLWHLRGHFHLDRSKNLAFIEFVVPELQEALPIFKLIRCQLSP